MYGRYLKKKMITDRILIRSKMFLSQEIVELNLDIKKKKTIGPLKFKK